MLKRRIPGIYSDTSIYSVTLRYVWEPKEGATVERMETSRDLPAVAVVLSKVRAKGQLTRRYPMSIWGFCES